MTPEVISAAVTLVAFLKDASVLGAVILFVNMLLKGSIITKREFDGQVALTKKAEDGEKFWRDEFFKLLPTTTGAIEVAKKAGKP